VVSGKGFPLGSLAPIPSKVIQEFKGSLLELMHDNIAILILSKLDLATASLARERWAPGCITARRTPESIPIRTITIRSSIRVKPDLLLWTVFVYIYTRFYNNNILHKTIWVIK